MENLLVTLDINAMWKLWVFVSIISIVVIDVCRIAYDCIEGEYAETRHEYRADMAWLNRWNWEPTKEEAAKLAADVAESKRLIAAYNEKQRQAMLAAASSK